MEFEKCSSKPQKEQRKQRKEKLRKKKRIKWKAYINIVLEVLDNGIMREKDKRDLQNVKE